MVRGQPQDSRDPRGRRGRLQPADGRRRGGHARRAEVRRALFGTLVREFDGRVFGSVGDSLMAEFPSAVNAVECAQAHPGRVADENAAVTPGAQMRLRIGVNLGDVIEGPDGVAGDAVNVAARLQALAKPGGVLISGTVYDQVHLKIPARYVDAGTRRVKNIEEPVRTFEVLPAAPPARRRARRGISCTSRRAARCGLRRIVVGFIALAARPFLARHPGADDRAHAGRAPAAAASRRRRTRSPCCRSST